jgi:hypothetical protein
LGRILTSSSSVSFSFLMASLVIPYGGYEDFPFFSLPSEPSDQPISILTDLHRDMHRSNRPITCFFWLNRLPGMLNLSFLRRMISLTRDRSILESCSIFATRQALSYCLSASYCSFVRPQSAESMDSI